MIPHITTKATTLGGHRIGKGVVAIPSITYSARSSGMSLEFDPSTPDDDHMFVKCVTFGGGQHKCPGRRYAESLLVVFLAVLAQGYDWRRAGSRRPTEDEFIYFPTIFPADTMFAITRREDEI
jgi:cytochrome P450